MSDVRVMAVKTGTVHVEDIGVSVPHGTVVSIPGDKALASKDLWRYISQRLLFQLHAGPIHRGSPVPLPDIPKPVATPQGSFPPPSPQVEALLKEALEQRERVLYAALMAQQERLLAVEAKLDAVLDAVKQPRVVVQAPVVSDRPRSTPRAEAELSDTPLFIPSEIGMKDVSARVNVSEEAQESAVGDAAAALRKLRRGAQAGQ